MADDVIKRMRYFDRQFLRAKDFQDEQAYALDRRQRHNRLLHTYGIAHGLIVQKSSVPGEETMVRVERGTAYDLDGCEIVLATFHKMDLSGVEVDPGPTYVSPLFLTIQYAEKPDPDSSSQDPGVTGFTRMLEEPRLQASRAVPADPHQLLLARIDRNTSNGNITEVNSQPCGRRRAGALPAGSVGSVELADGAVQSHHIALVDPGEDQTPTSGSGVKTRHLKDGGVIESKLANNAVSNRTIQDNAVSNRTIQDNTINEAKFDVVTRGKLVTNGDSHDHSGGDGAPIKHSALAKDDGSNPHGTTAADVGAIATSGGSIRGRLTVEAGSAPRVLLGTGPIGFATGLQIENRPGSPSNLGIVVIGSDMRNELDGATTFYGPVTFDGGKGTYVFDRFINRSGVTLRTGDVVKLKGTPIVRFEGDLNKIPIPEVTLADRENDPAVIGIVDREAIPRLDEPDTRSAPEDPTAIPEGGDLLVVTLGSYAHCKVDATEAPIEVGDLLTSSANPGHARKATDPKIGSIIGKALEPLKESTGYIAVFVNIQ